jgi:hypothetical protein
VITAYLEPAGDGDRGRVATLARERMVWARGLLMDGEGARSKGLAIGGEWLQIATKCLFPGTGSWEHGNEPNLTGIVAEQGLLPLAVALLGSQIVRTEQEEDGMVEARAKALARSWSTSQPGGSRSSCQSEIIPCCSSGLRAVSTRSRQEQNTSRGRSLSSSV